MHHDVENDSERPDVEFLVVVGLAQDGLRRLVEGRSDHAGVWRDLGLVDEDGHPIVDDSDFVLALDVEDVVHFEVAVVHVDAVQIADALANLVEDVHDLVERKLLVHEVVTQVHRLGDVVVDQIGLVAASDEVHQFDAVLGVLVLLRVMRVG